MNLRSMLLVALLAGALSACKAANASFDEDMSVACEMACAAKDYDPAKVVPQERAQVGDLVRCPVSGVVFVLKADHPTVEHDGKRFRTCCAGCAKKFDANPQRFGNNET